MKDNLGSAGASGSGAGPIPRHQDLSTPLDRATRAGLSAAYGKASKLREGLDPRAFFVQHAAILRLQAEAIDRLVASWDAQASPPRDEPIAGDKSREALKNG